MSDLTSAADAMQQWPLLSVCAPGLHFASLMGKMGPWRQEVGTMWEKVFRLAAVTSVCQSEKSMLSSVSLRSLQHVEATMHSASCGLSDNPHIYSPPFSLGLLRSVRSTILVCFDPSELSVLETQQLAEYIARRTT